METESQSVGNLPDSDSNTGFYLLQSHSEDTDFSIKKKVCSVRGHLFTPVDESDYRKVSNGNTYIRRSFLCVQCGEVISPIVAVWEGFVPVPKGRKANGG